MAVIPVASVASEAAPKKPIAVPLKDPVTLIMKTFVYRMNNNLVALAEAMPAEKYSFKTGREEQTFGRLLIDVALVNNSLCSAASGDVTASPEQITENDSKAKLVAALKASFERCKTSLLKINDRQLGDIVPFSREMWGPRADALFTLIDTWSEHYGKGVIYLRVNGMEPPAKDNGFAPKKGVH